MSLLGKRRQRLKELAEVYDDPRLFFPPALAAKIDAFRETREGKEPDRFSPLTRSNRRVLLLHGGIMAVKTTRGADGFQHLIPVLSDLLDVVTDTVVVFSSRLDGFYTSTSELPFYEATAADLIRDVDVFVVIGLPTSRQDQTALTEILNVRHGHSATIVTSPDTRTAASTVAGLVGPLLTPKWFLVPRTKNGETSYKPVPHEWLRETKKADDGDNW